ncbi:MAG TPA: peptidase E [Candidatus Saccharimonadales bacterium]|nr:peptidase E [Candidatus Saccharimonadales bacterium]
MQHLPHERRRGTHPRALRRANHPRPGRPHRRIARLSRHIVGVGGQQLEHPAIPAYVLELAGAPRPRALFIPTAAGDDPAAIERFETAYGADRCERDVLRLFGRDDDLATPIAAADVIVVSGGSTLNLLALWRLHGVVDLIRAAYERGAVLTGASAGCICWFADGITDSYGPTLRPLGDGLGWLAGSACPHYDGEPTRRPTYLDAMKNGRITPGYAIDDAVALHFEDERFVEAVSPRPNGRAFRVDHDGEHPLPVRLIG